MSGIQVSQAQDLVTTTLQNLGEFEWSQYATDIQEYVAARQLLRTNRMSKMGGDSIDFNLMYDSLGTAEEVGLFNTDSISFKDVMTTATVPWRHAKVDFPIEVREMKINRGPSRIVNLVEARRAAAMISWVELLEDRFWALADAGQALHLWGLMNYVVYNASEGFTGNLPTGYSTVAGVNATTVSRWRNWSNNYSAITQADLVTKMRAAATKTKFKSPVTNPTYSTGDRYGYYCNYDVYSAFELLLRDQNSDLGNDIAAKDGDVVFRRIPMTWVPQLDNNSADPVYGIDWGTLKYCVLEGEFMRQTGPQQRHGAHNTLVTFYDTTMNLVCYDRRRQFVIAKSDPSA